MLTPSSTSPRLSRVTPSPAFRLRGHVVHGMSVTDLLTVTDPQAYGILIDTARDMERRGVQPAIKFHRGADGRIDGVTLGRVTDEPKSEGQPQ